MAVIGIAFFLLMFALRANMYLNIAVSVIFVMVVFIVLYREAKGECGSDGT